MSITGSHGEKLLFIDEYFVESFYTLVQRLVESYEKKLRVSFMRDLSFSG